MIQVNEEKNIGSTAGGRKTEQGQWLTLDGCPISPGPWFVRAATFCDDGIPSFEVVMPGEPHMSAVDARVIGAAPMLHEAAKEALRYVNLEPVLDDDGITVLGLLRDALALVNMPANESAKRPVSDHDTHGPASLTERI